LVATTFLKLFAAFVLGAPILFVLGDVTERLDDYLERGVPGLDVIKAYLYEFPNFVLYSFPIAALVAAVFTIHFMTTHREIVAAKAGGVSFHRLVAPLVGMGILLTGVALGLSEVVPTTNRIAAELRLERSARRNWRAYFVFRGEDGTSMAIRRLSVAENTIEGVVLETEPDDISTTPALHLVADEARFDEENGWTFDEGYLRQLSAEGSQQTFGFTQMRMRGLGERPEDLLEEPRDDEEMTYGELGRLAEMIRRSGGDPGEYLVKKEQKRAIPVATLVIILFGAPLATTSKRGGAAFGIGVSLGSTILYMLLFKLAGAFGATGNLDPLLAAWLPNGLFFVTGCVLLTRVRT
jgi:lipopolysaccharide export system permease protein